MCFMYIFELIFFCDTDAMPIFSLFVGNIYVFLLYFLFNIALTLFCLEMPYFRVFASLKFSLCQKVCQKDFFALSKKALFLARFCRFDFLDNEYIS